MSSGATWVRGPEESVKSEPVAPRAATQSGDPKAAYATTKPALHLNPPAGEIHQSCSMLNGAIKYGPFNWREGDGVEVMTYIGAMKRHIAQFEDGEDTETDPITGITFHHLAAVMATASIVLDAKECGKLIDNRPPKGAASALIQRLTVKKEKSSGV